MVNINMSLRLIILAVFVFVGSSAYADTSLKNLVLDALKNGKSEGVITDNVADIFKNATGSKEPIKVTIKKIEKYDAGCGRLHVEMKQAGIKDSSGNLTTGEPWFDISICPNGRPPMEVLLAEQERKATALKSCTAKAEKGAIDKDTGSIHGTMTVKGCPANGKAQWHYTGSCTTLKMPEGMVSSFPIDKDGNLTFKLLIPSQCKNAQNSWISIIRESNGMILGNINAAWPAIIKEH